MDLQTLQEIYFLVHLGLEKTCQQELQEKGNIVSTSGRGLVICSLAPEKWMGTIRQLQSIRAVLLGMGRFPDISLLSSSLHSVLGSFPWNELNAERYALELEHFSTEQRQELLPLLGKELIKVWIKEHITWKQDYKQADVRIVLHHTGKEILMGIDLAGRELHKRSYRVFPHAAGFTGDIAYYLVRKTGYIPGERLCIGFVKDGSLAIEAALLADHLPLVPAKTSFAAERLFPSLAISPILPSPLSKTTPPETTPPEASILAFDPSRQNIIAARKNAKIAGVSRQIDIQRYAVDEMDMRYGESAVDRLLFHLTTKDEDALGELFHQATYILKPRGTFVLITRKVMELSIPDEFRLLQQEELVRGDSVQRIWLLEKKENVPQNTQI